MNVQQIINCFLERKQYWIRADVMFISGSDFSTITNFLNFDTACLLITKRYTVCIKKYNKNKKNIRLYLWNDITESGARPYGEWVFKYQLL